MNANRYSFVLCFVLFSICTALSQVVTQVCAEEGITIKDKEYFIEINGIKYEDKSQVYLCESSLPVTLKILYNRPFDPLHEQRVLAEWWDWGQGSNCECVTTSPQDYEASFIFDNYRGDDKATIKLNFKEFDSSPINPGKKVGLKIDLINVNEVSINDN